MTPEDAVTWSEMLAETTEQLGDANEARWLCEHASGLDGKEFRQSQDEYVTTAMAKHLHDMVRRRLAGEPLQYVMKRWAFRHLDVHVDQRVLIPRPETEELVEHALGFLQNKSTENLLTRVLDIGCGSGAIAISLALENPILEVTASDISADALWVAQFNANELGAKNVRFVQSDLFNNLLNQSPALAFDLICSNPPYIQLGDEHLSQGDLRFEPPQALTDGGDGLRFYREIAEHSPALLRAGGGVLVEHGYNQQEAVKALFSKAPYVQVQGLPDLAGTPRFVFAHI